MILCCGEALIDFVPLPDGQGYQPCPGGSAFNIAVGLGRLEAPAGFFCKLSTDFFGDMLVDHLNENGVDTSRCIRVDNPTTLAFVSLPSDGGETQFSFYANDSADRLLTAAELPQLPDMVTALHFGSISLVMEPGASALEALMARERRRRIISLDPNVRPGLIGDANGYRRRFEGWMDHVDIIRLSQVDFDFLYPREAQRQQISRWFQKGIALCIVTSGEDGAAAYTAAGDRIHAAPPAVEVIDTVGAGDTFLAALMAHFDRAGLLANREHILNLTGEQLLASLHYANLAAAINCARKGANPPTRLEMAEAMP